jgi:hypothetical protein
LGGCCSASTGTTSTILLDRVAATVLAAGMGELGENLWNKVKVVLAGTSGPN